ncbi:MAG: aminotransferase class I/II-fold pyridoxal phosphate-dependent enzyme [Clostridiaceae bacterium]|nr:aminotransferase class I/II-fold pyridoxal phosphate-dependent enzyme [Clostridiaceae bacterium]
MIIREGIKRAIGHNKTRFFMPGHKGDGRLSLYYDVTEIDGTDNLQNPDGIIKKAMDNAAHVFGAKKTFFLVNGSSVGIGALVMSLCNRGETLIVDRACHISVINAIILNDIRPVFIYPEYNKKFGIYNSINSLCVEDALIKHPNAKGVLITSPNYYGVCSNVEIIAQLTHKYNKALIVDEAHGAHFVFGNSLPKAALLSGADGVIQSAHKTLCCITQGALLHLGSSRIDADCVRENLNMLHTTSPSYLIMMSIDDSVTKASKSSDIKTKRVIEQCKSLKENINKTGKLICLNSNDVTRITINAGKNANCLNYILKKDYNIISEMCDGQNIVFIANMFSSAKDIKKLENALIGISKKLLKSEPLPNIAPPRLKLAMTPAAAYYNQTETVIPQLSVDRIAARAIYKMPPCTCAVLPGETITQEAAQFITGKVKVVKR